MAVDLSVDDLAYVVNFLSALRTASRDNDVWLRDSVPLWIDGDIVGYVKASGDGYEFGQTP